jgi:hypothetical protein
MRTPLIVVVLLITVMLLTCDMLSYVAGYQSKRDNPNDPGAPNVSVFPTTGLVTTESGATASFTIKLKTQPTANVTIALSSSDTTEGTVVPLSITFASTNWSVAQTVTVTGVDDQVPDGDQQYTIITGPASSRDSNYNGLNPVDVAVTNTENPPVYSTDFASDPGWATSDPSRFYWDSGQQAYLMNRINIDGGGNYAIREVGVNMAGRSFRLEWDIKMVSVDYACDLRFGLFDSDMNAEDNGSFAWVILTREDRGYQILMGSRGSDNVSHGDSTEGTQYSVGTWYHVVMSYDAATGQLSATIIDRSTTNLVRSLSTTTGAFAADMDRVGISDIRQGAFQVPGAQAQGYVDNVQLVLP